MTGTEADVAVGGGAAGVVGVGVGAAGDAITGRSVDSIAGSGVAVATAAEVVGDAAASKVRVGIGSSEDPLHATARNANAATTPTKRPVLARNRVRRSIVAG